MFTLLVGIIFPLSVSTLFLYNKKWLFLFGWIFIWLKILSFLSFDIFLMKIIVVNILIILLGYIMITLMILLCDISRILLAPNNTWLQPCPNTQHPLMIGLRLSFRWILMIFTGIYWLLKISITCLIFQLRYLNILMINCLIYGWCIIIIIIDWWWIIIDLLWTIVGWW